MANSRQKERRLFAVALNADVYARHVEDPVMRGA